MRTALAIVWLVLALGAVAVGVGFARQQYLECKSLGFSDAYCFKHAL